MYGRKEKREKRRHSKVKILNDTIAALNPHTITLSQNLSTIIVKSYTWDLSKRRNAGKMLFADNIKLRVI